LSQSSVIVVGAGVAGLCCALELSESGYAVEVVERGRALGDGCCSWMAGGMLAPWCERATTEPAVALRGAPSIDWWVRHFAGTVRQGSLVVAQARDMGELSRFAGRTGNFQWVDGERLAELEPDLAGRYRRALFFPDEGHLDPRRALAALADALRTRSVPIRFGVDFSPARSRHGLIVDCRGLAAGDALSDLRGVRGEMLVIRSRDLEFSRPVRMLHPRIPLYVVPRGAGIFMVGATMIESEARGGPTVRSAVDLLNAAYALHPAFGEAEILEINADVRPAFPDNLPAVRQKDRILYANGLYRHGFLLAPALAREVAERTAELLPSLETIDADLRERRPA
jgi:glycine oxidase